MSKRDNTEATEAPKPKLTKKKIMLLGVAVVLLTVAGVAGKTMLAGPKGPEKPEAGAVVPMDALTINLANGHYLKLKLALQTTADAEKPDGSQALDLAISRYSHRDMAEFSSAAGLAKAKGELLEAVQEAYEGHVMDIYFTEFVMQ